LPVFEIKDAENVSNVRLKIDIGAREVMTFAQSDVRMAASGPVV